VGPQIFPAGQLLNTPQIPVPFVETQVQTEQDVRQEVRTQAAAGVDYTKLYVVTLSEKEATAWDPTRIARTLQCQVYSKTYS
jgi:hypothetical protein